MQIGTVHYYIQNKMIHQYGTEILVITYDLSKGLSRKKGGCPETYRVEEGRRNDELSERSILGISAVRYSRGDLADPGRESQARRYHTLPVDIEEISRVGTALSVFYLHHRSSEDLDFFSVDEVGTFFAILLDANRVAL